MIDERKLEDAVSVLIRAIGENPDREGLRDTPGRVARMYSEFFSGLEQDPSEVLTTAFEEGHDGMVVFDDVPFFSICEHHLLPFHGTASVGYVPNGRVVGASKVGRALDILARRPQMQERLTRQLVDAIFNTLQPQGVGAVLRAEHMCMSLRGVKKPGSRVVTSANRGTFEAQEPVLREFRALLGSS